LIVHLGIIFVNNQLDTQFFFIMFIFILYMFQAATRPSSGELVVSIHLVCVTLYRWPFGVQVWMRQSHPNLYAKRSSIQSDTYQMSYWYN